MKIPAISVLICLTLAATAAAEGPPGGKPGSSGGSQGSTSEIRALVHDLQGKTEKLADLNGQYRSLVEQRPQGNDAQLEKWQAALDRLLVRIDAQRAVVVEAKARLEKAATGTLSTSLGKDVANARNEADAERVNAEQALAKAKQTKGKAAKPPKQKPAEKEPPPLPDDLDL